MAETKYGRNKVKKEIKKIVKEWREKKKKVTNKRNEEIK